MQTRTKKDFFRRLENITPSLSSDSNGSATCAKERKNSPAIAPPRTESTVQYCRGLLGMPRNWESDELTVVPFLLAVLTGMKEMVRHGHDLGISSVWGQLCI